MFETLHGKQITPQQTPDCLNLSFTSAGVVVRVQEVTIAAGAVVSANVVVTEMVTHQLFIGAFLALINICADRETVTSFISCNQTWREVINDRLLHSHGTYDIGNKNSTFTKLLC